METHLFTKFEIVPKTPRIEAESLQQRLDEARKIGIANQYDNVLTRLYNEPREQDDKVIIETATALFPKKSLRESEMFGIETDLFDGPYLSVIGQIYTGIDFKRPEKYLVHVRSKKTFQGNEQVSAPYAGYCEYIIGDKIIHPVEVAVKEFKEEVKRFSDLDPLFVQDEDGWILTDEPDMTLGMPMHYMKDYRTGEATIRNPLLNFVNYVEPKYEKEYPVVENLGQLDDICRDTEDFEVMGTAWVPADKTENFWNQVEDAGRVYSISRDIFTGWEYQQKYQLKII